MTQTIAVPAYILQNKALVLLRETCLALLQDGDECPSALACIAAVNVELDERALATYRKYHPTLCTETAAHRRPNLYIVE